MVLNIFISYVHTHTHHMKKTDYNADDIAIYLLSADNECTLYFICSLNLLFNICLI